MHLAALPASTALGEVERPQAAKRPRTRGWGHKHKEHGQCTKCHDAHGATLPGRAECLSCHTDKTKHQPDAQRCFGCHPFK
ncbi:MAG: hypothetical protein IPM35_24640 [Myxococcales bacterium]|nr:hypothetical protein [Myxococcales bacterium]